MRPKNSTNINSAPNNAPAEKHSPMGLIIFLIIVILIVLGFFFFMGSGEEQRTQINDDLERVTPREEGAVVANFPQELLLEQNQTVSQSYSINYIDGSAQQPVVTYTSAWLLADNVRQFRNYFESNGWTVEVDADPESTGVTSFYAVRGEEQTNITFNVQHDGSVQVTVAYLTTQTQTQETE